MLLSISNMDRPDIFYNKIPKKLVHVQFSLDTDVACHRGHLYLQWNELIVFHFTFAGLRRLHRQFGHPHVDKLVNLLKFADISSVKKKLVACSNALNVIALRVRSMRKNLNDFASSFETIPNSTIQCTPTFFTLTRSLRYKFLTRQNVSRLPYGYRKCFLKHYGLCYDATG